MDLGFKPFGGQTVDIAYFFGAFGEIGYFDQPLFEETFEDVVDLAQADAGVIGQFALGGDGSAAEDVQDGEVFFCGFHWVLGVKFFVQG